MSSSPTSYAATDALSYSFSISSPLPNTTAIMSTNVVKPKIGIIWYSMYGHVSHLAEAAIRGAEAAGAEVRPYNFQETLPADLVKKIGGGASLEPKHPVITPEALVELDGFLIGAPTRFGRMPAQVSAFLDSTGAQYAQGSLVGKFAGTFTSSNSQHGGQETTHLNIFPYFAHQGIIFVPNGYQFKYAGDTASVHGASPYGASTIAGADGSFKPNEEEIAVAESQGKNFAEIVGAYLTGKAAIGK